MTGGAGADGPSRRVWAAAAAGLLALVAATYGLLTLARPYHLDTLLYLDSVRRLLTDGTLASALPSRIGNTWLQLPGVALLGEAGLRWTNVVAGTATAALYLHVLRRDFGRTVAWAATATLVTAPAVLVTVTHLKEDGNALLLVAAALALLGPRAGLARAAAAGAACGAAMLVKEFAAVLVPFVGAHLYLARAAPTSWRDLPTRRAAAAAAPALLALFGATAATVALLSPDHLRAVAELTRSPHTGQFVGLGVLLDASTWSDWREAALHLAPWTPLAAVAVAVDARAARVRTPLWAGAALALFVVLATTTVSRARVHGPVLFLLLPVVWRGAHLCAEWLWRAMRRGGAAAPALPAVATGAAAAALAAWNLADVRPTLAYRAAYPPQAAYFGALGRALPADAVLYGMDSCSLAVHFTGRPCRTHPVDPAPAAAQAFVDGLLAEAGRLPVVLLHDFSAYDAGGGIVAGLVARARLEPAFVALGEDYHDVSWVPDWDELASRLERAFPGCRAAGVTRSPLPAAPPGGFTGAEVALRCGDGARAFRYVAFQGHPTALSELVAVRVRPP